MGDSGTAEILRAVEETATRPDNRLKYVYLAGNGLGTCKCRTCVHDRIDTTKTLPTAIHFE